MNSRTEVDVVVVGVGTCGEDLSLQLLDAGLRVVGVEASLVGGECPYWACMPSKRMIRSGNLLAEARRGDGTAGHVSVEADWSLVSARVREEVTGGWDDSYAVERFEARGGTLVRGNGRLTGPKTVAVGDRTFVARRGVVVATGSRPAVPPIPGLAKVDHWTTHDVIAAETLPESLIVLGGGAVGCELGQLLTRFGVDVTIVEAGERLLPAEEPEASQVVTAALKAEGVSVVAGATVEHVASEEGSVVVDLASGDRVRAAQLLVATGRVVDVSDLGLETVGLDGSAQNIETDDRMRAADGLWAVGDVTGRAMLTHIALYQGAIAVSDIVDRPHPPARYDAVPRVTFTDPEVGAVGMTEAEAEAAGLDTVVAVKQLPATFRGWLHAAGNAGLVKLVIDSSSGRLIGATAAGPHGGEVLGMLALAVHAQVPLADLRSMIYAFPTFYGAIGEAIGAYGRGVGTVLDPTYDALAALDAVDLPG
jgi:pyruvate/2-oxoglutarate dehydrogenase complex dihydrolipoamide dehydrogenase (E3) component